jgi:hypothetical protein
MVRTKELRNFALIDDIDVMIETYMQKYNINYARTNNLKTNKDFVTKLYKRLTKFCRHDFLKYLRENHADIYLNKDNYDFSIIQTGFHNAVWYSKDDDKEEVHKFKNFPNMIETFKEIDNYGLHSIFTKSLTKDNNEYNKHINNTACENVFTAINSSDNQISKIKNDTYNKQHQIEITQEKIFKYLTEVYDASQIIKPNGKIVDQVDGMMNEIFSDLTYLEYKLSNYMHELMFVFIRYDTNSLDNFDNKAICSFFNAIMNNFNYFESIDSKFNNKLSYIIEFIIKYKKVNELDLTNIGFFKYFEKYNIEDTKKNIFNKIIHNSDVWIDNWVRNHSDENKNDLYERGYRTLFTIFGLIYSKIDNNNIKLLILKKIYKIFSKGIYRIEHSLLYFFANTKFDFENLNKDEKKILREYLNIYLINNKNVITRLYIIDTFNQIVPNIVLRELL